MRYILKEKAFALGNDFTIRDADDQAAFVVDGKVFSLGHRLSFRDPSGQELASIEQKLLSWGPTYEIYRAGRLQAVVKKSLFTMIRHRFTVDVEGPDDLEAEGDFFSHEYVFRRGDRPIAVVSKRWFAWTDTYGVEVEEGEDAVLILASAVVIDMVLDDESR